MPGCGVGWGGDLAGLGKAAPTPAAPPTLACLLCCCRLESSPPHAWILSACMRTCRLSMGEAWGASPVRATAHQAVTPAAQLQAALPVSLESTPGDLLVAAELPPPEARRAVPWQAAIDASAALERQVAARMGERTSQLAAFLGGLATVPQVCATRRSARAARAALPLGQEPPCWRWAWCPRSVRACLKCLSLLHLHGALE